MISRDKHNGISMFLLDNLIDILSRYGRIFITSETVLDAKYDRYVLKMEPNLMHHLLSFATLFIGDSQSMCFEAGLLGTPYIRYNDFVMVKIVFLMKWNIPTSLE